MDPRSPSIDKPPLARERTPANARRVGMTGVVAYVGLATACLLLAGLAFLWVAWPADLIRERLTSSFAARTGRTLAIEGSIALQLWPMGLRLERVVIRGPEPSPVALVTIDEVAVALSPWRLLTAEPRAERITVHRPRLTLHVDADGRHNWGRAGLGDKGDRRAAETDPTQPADQPVPPASTRAPRRAEPVQPRRRALGVIEIVGGTLVVDDRRSERRIEAADVAGMIRQAETSDPVVFDGRLTWAGEVGRIAGRIASLPRYSTEAVPVDLSLVLPTGRVAFAGTAATADGLAFDGDLSLASPSTKGFLRKFGLVLPDSAVDGPLSAQGRVARSRTTIRVRDMRLTTPALEGVAAVEVDFSGARPRAIGDLTLARLDLDALLGENARPSPRDTAPQPPSSDAANDPAEPEPSATQVPGRAHRTARPRMRPWRDDDIAFSAIERVAGALRLEVVKLTWRSTDITNVRANLDAADGTLRINLTEAAIFGGRAEGLITVRTDGRLAIEARIGDANALDMLRTTARFDVLEGPAHLELAVAGSGRTEREIVASLSGTGRFEIAKGAIRGWSVSEIIEEARRLQLPALARRADARTPFETLVVALSIKDGVATASEGRIVASPLSLDSVGTIDLPQQTLRITLSPRVASSASRFSGLSVPLTLSGPWARPRLDADYKRILRSPGKALEAAREAARGLKEEDVDKAARRLLGDSPEAKKGADRAKRLLRRFLKE